MHVTESDSRISRHIPKLCLSLTDPVNNVSYQKCTWKPVSVSVEDRNPLCKHYLLSAQYRFLICNRVVVVYWVYLLLHEHLESHFHNRNDLKGPIWSSGRVISHRLPGENDL